MGQCSGGQRGKGSGPRRRIGLSAEGAAHFTVGGKEVMTLTGASVFPARGECGSHTHGHNYGPDFLPKAYEVIC